MLNPARANNWIVASCSEPFGMPSFSLAIFLFRVIRVIRGCSLAALSVALIRGHLPVETGPLAGVADITVAEPLHFEQHRVLVAVHQHLGDLQPVAGGFPLRPQRVARAAEERGKAGRLRPLERLVVHEPHHQYSAAGVVLDDRWYESQEKRKIHKYLI